MDKPFFFAIEWIVLFYSLHLKQENNTLWVTEEFEGKTVFKVAHVRSLQGISPTDKAGEMLKDYFLIIDL